MGFLSRRQKILDTYTCITEIRGSMHVSQHSARSAEDALRIHIGRLPYDDGAGPFEDELAWLQSITSGTEPVKLLPVAPSAWLWSEGARYEPPYTTYVVKTNVVAE